MTIETSERARTLPAVQHLRGIAAAMVVASHCCAYLIESDPRFAPLAPLVSLGPLGVDVFFVISGFVMYYTCRHRWDGSVAAAAGFLGRRLHRIVPLYWLVTLAQLAILLVAQSDDAEGGVTPGEVLLSLLFVPYGFDGLKFRPVLGVGWTLDFEMFFYLLFALALLLPRRIGLTALAAMLAGAILLGQAIDLPLGAIAALAQPIVALFGLGVLLGWLRDQSDWRIPAAAGDRMLLAGTLASALLLVPIPADDSYLWFDPRLWTIAIALAALAIFTRPAAQQDPVARFGLALGDASYLLYLAHTLVIQVMREGAERLGIASPVALAALATLMFAVSVVIAFTGHRLVERRLLRWTAPLFRRERIGTRSEHSLDKRNMSGT